MENCDNMGGLGEYPVCHCLGSLSFFGFLVTRTGCTSGPILTIYTSYDVFPRKDVPFGGCIDTAPHFGSQITQKPRSRGMNRHFQPNAQNIQTFILQKLLMHSNQILSDDKDPQVLLVDGPKMCPTAVIL